jgi:hypothetical protein
VLANGLGDQIVRRGEAMAVVADKIGSGEFDESGQHLSQLLAGRAGQQRRGCRSPDQGKQGQKLPRS